MFVGVCWPKFQPDERSALSLSSAILLNKTRVHPAQNGSNSDCVDMPDATSFLPWSTKMSLVMHRVIFFLAAALSSAAVDAQVYREPARPAPEWIGMPEGAYYNAGIRVNNFELSVACLDLQWGRSDTKNQIYISVRNIRSIANQIDRPSQVILNIDGIDNVMTFEFSYSNETRDLNGWFRGDSPTRWRSAAVIASRLSRGRLLTVRIPAMNVTQEVTLAGSASELAPIVSAAQTGACVIPYNR